MYENNEWNRLMCLFRLSSGRQFKLGSGCEGGGRIPERTSSGLHRAKLVYMGITSVQDTLLAQNKTDFLITLSTN